MTQFDIDEQIEELAGGEFERQPVPQSRLKSWKSFLGMYAGEHAAGTEFVIGPLFLTTGVSAFDLIIGLLVGNLLAVLSWRLTYHVVPGKVTSSDIAGKKLEAKTVEGQDVAIDGTNGVTVNNATVTGADVMASNGVIHVIDTVLLPK